MSNITGAVFAPLLLAPLIVKFLDKSQVSGSSNGTTPTKEKVDLSYYEIGDRCSSASDGKLLRPNMRCIHGIVQPKL